MNTQQIAESLLQLTNEKKRRDFIINTYREWEPAGMVRGLGLEYFKLTLPSGRQIIAMEYPIYWKSGGRDVVYYDVPKGQAFSVHTTSAYQAAAGLASEREIVMEGQK